jgi:prolyl-tRNA editing enzyme YbaK/EbsC (Cys-tRNA(Pro) deacylase)
MTAPRAPEGVPLSASAQRVQDAIREGGFDFVVLELEREVRTAADAAGAVGCAVGQIVKSLVFKGARSGRGVLVLTSGSNRVDEARVSAHLGEPLARAEPAFVRRVTGFAIGGIPPIGHAEAMETFIDEDLLRFDTVWAAAGHPASLFALPAADLPRLAPGRVVRVS